MNAIKVLAIIAATSLAMTSCKTSNKAVQTKADVPAAYVTSETSLYNYPLADTIIKYSSEGTASKFLTDRITEYASLIGPNLEGKATVMQFGEGIVVSLDRGNVFGVEGYNLNKNSEDILRSLAFNLQQMPDTYILVTGRTDATGTVEYNKNLAYRRAAVVANYLHGCGVDDARFFVDSFGERFPDFGNKTKADRDRNRRVDFLIIPSNEMRESAAK